MPTIPEVTPKISPPTNPKDTTPVVCDAPSRVITRRLARLANKSQPTVLSSPNMEKNYLHNHVQYSYLPPKSTKSQSRPVITQDKNEPPPPSRRTSIGTNSLCRPACISQEVLYHIVGVGYTNAHIYTIPPKLEKTKLCIMPAIDIEDYCGAVVHPVTNETITKYKQLANDSVLKEAWTKDMAKEQGIHASGYRLFFNVEKGGGQVIFHIHLHLIGGWKS